MAHKVISVDETMVRSPKFVAFFGPDGAGKSTQAELMVKYFQSTSLKVKKAWIRSPHTFAYLLWKLFFRLNLCQDQSGIPLKGGNKFAVSYLHETPYGIVSPITMTPPRLKGRISKNIWSIIEVVSVLPVILIQVYIPLMLGYVVVAERYVVDSIASISYFLGDKKFAEGWQARFLLRFVPKGTVFVFVDASYETVLERRGELAGPYEYTEFHRQVYVKLARLMRALRTDTSELPVQETHQRILQFVFEINQN